MMEKNRKQRKARWLRFKNAYRRWPNCTYGQAFCDHVYEEQYPWAWVDFRFPSAAHKRRYYAVAAQTLGYLAVCDAEDQAWQLVDEQLGEPEFKLVKAHVDKSYGQLWELKDPEDWQELNEKRVALHKEIFLELAKKPVVMRETIEVRLEYGPVAIGLWAKLNRDALSPQWLDEFAGWYKSLGEPLKQGVVWQGEEVEIVPAKVYAAWQGE